MSNGNYASTTEKPYEGEMLTDEQLASLTVMTNTRNDFEAHFKLCMRQKRQHKNGDYLDTDIQRMWHGWQAAQGRDAQDAARYRWLCEAFGVTYFPVALERLLTGDDGVYIADGKPAIDAAIDAAMK